MPVDTKPEASAAVSTPESNVKETIESILVAFILAFIFRAFVVEAFVIPTGSMAPTLYGAHMRLHCPDCGYTFDAGFAVQNRGDDTNIPSEAPRKSVFHCPNCGYAIAPSRVVGSDRDAAYVADQQVRFGDRILVLKYLYLFQEPKRWDVVVFKAPVLSPGDRYDQEYSENYIKRLAGKPNESLVILDGALYMAPGRADIQSVDGVVKGAEQFTIQRRPPYVQQRLWRMVNDNDYLPFLNRSTEPEQTDWRQPWKTVAESGWRLSDDSGRPSRTFRFDNAGNSGTVEFDPNANPDTHPLTDWLAYDSVEHNNIPWHQQFVSDLKLNCFYTRTSGDGALELQLTKRDDCFIARFLPGRVTLWRESVERRPTEAG